MENWIVRDKIFSEENMYAKMMNFAKNENLTQTAKALPYAREKHTGQTRKSGIFSAGKSSSEKIPYIIHPLMMACHAHAMGLRDDAVLASILLHDVCEDCGIEPAELPFSEEVQQIVDLLTLRLDKYPDRASAKAAYFARLCGPCLEKTGAEADGGAAAAGADDAQSSSNGAAPSAGDRAAHEQLYNEEIHRKACFVKAVDRCNNVSMMASGFELEKISDYIAETEKYILPILDIIKFQCPEYHDAAFLLKYQILSAIESEKMMVLRGRKK